MLDRRPILVTGSHRSGTGWVGSVIASGPEPVAYLWEPFSPLARPGICEAPFDRWFQYVTVENETPFLGPIAETLRFRYHPIAETRSIRSPKDALRLPRDWFRMERWRRRRAVPLMKDPIAVFSAQWLADTYGMDPIVLLRHPGGFVGSIVGRRLRHPFSDFLEQPLLMRDMLDPFRADIERARRTELPLLDQGILLWRLIHHAIAAYMDSRPAWRFDRLEDIAEDPQPAFEEIFEYVGLPLTDEVRAFVAEHSDSSNPVETLDMASHKRDSKASVWSWQRRLSEGDIARIRDEVGALGERLYPETYW